MAARMLRAAVVAAALAGQATGAAVVRVHPGDSLQAVVEKNPAGTTFSLASGTYRLQEIRPKDNDSFVAGDGSPVLTGAALITGFRKSGQWFSAPYQPQQEQLHGMCGAANPMCNHPQDCFRDNKPLRRVATVAELKSGSCFLDSSRRVVQLADDPAGHTIEISTARSAFSGTAVNVTITGLTVEKYAIPAQMGAIGDQSPGERWSITKCTVRWNHGAGIVVAGGSFVGDNRVLENGQLGIAAHGDRIVVQNNEIASNNYAGFEVGWEAGGTKFSHTTGLAVKGNKVHDNAGPGLWTDTDNRGTTYEGNTVSNNSGDGIKHEVSFDAKIVGNMVSGNGRAQSVWLWGSQILIQNSSGAEVSGNTVVVPDGYGNGIGVIIQNRGEYLAKNNFIHDNDITFRGASGGHAGVVCDYAPEASLVPTNRFDANHYHVPDTGRSHWLWEKEVKWDDFRRNGSEVHGSLDMTLR